MKRKRYGAKRAVRRGGDNDTANNPNETQKAPPAIEKVEEKKTLPAQEGPKEPAPAPAPAPVPAPKTKPEKVISHEDVSVNVPSDDNKKPEEAAADKGGDIKTATSAPTNKVTVDEGTFSKIFNQIYIVLAVFSVLTLFLMMMLIFINFDKILTLKKKEDQLAKNNKLIIQDTIEYKFISYAVGTSINTKKSSKPTQGEEKVLMIYPLIDTMNIMFKIASLFIIFVLSHIVISVTLYLWKSRKSDTSITTLRDLIPNINKTAVIIIAVCLTFALALYVFIKYMFVENSIQKVLAYFSTQSSQLKKKLYDNLFIDRDFLDAITSDNYDAILNFINNRITKNPEEAYRMIFTYNIYKHYTNYFTASSPYLVKFRNTFTFEGFKLVKGAQRFEPIEFLQYGNNMNSLTFYDYFLNNLNINIQANNDNISTSLKNSYITNQINGVSIQSYVNTKLKNLNDNTRNLTESNLDKAYDTIYSLLTTLFGFVVFMLVIGLLVMTFYEPSRLWLVSMGRGVYDFLSKIADFIAGLFSKKKA